MTAPVKEPPEHVRNAETKAALIAAALHRRGLWPRDIAHLPDTSRKRNVLTLAAFARVAFRESPDPAVWDRNPPGERDSQTWVKVTEKLTAWDRGDDDPPPRDLVDDRGRWLAPADTTTVEAPCGSSRNPDPTASAATAGTPTTAPPASPAPQSSSASSSGAAPTQPASPRPSAAAPPSTQPRGWADVAALPPLGHGWCIHHPLRRPVIITPDGGRCGDCPPRRGERFTVLAGMRRDGWGMHLDWTPRSNRYCAPARCWCGRCPPREATQ